MHTVDATSDQSIKDAVHEALSFKNFSSYIPYEFTQKVV